MTFVLPIALPASLVTERRLVAKHDFAHTHHTVAFGPDGRGYVHSELFYNYRRYDQGDGEIAAQIVTCLRPDFAIAKQVWLEDLHAEMTHGPDGQYVFNNTITPLAVTALGEVVFATATNRTFVLDAELGERVARFDPLRGEPAGLSDVVVVPGGIVGARDRDALGVAADPAPLGAGLPSLRAVGSIRELAGDPGLRGYLGHIAALDLDRILVARFTARGRSGWLDDAAFRYTVVGGDGRIVGTFPLGAADTPYGKAGAHDTSYVAHRPLAGWLVRSDAALHVFDRDAARVARIGLAEDDRFDALVPLTLAGVGPAGELVMVHRKHHLLVITDPVRDPSELEPALVAAGAVYAAELARLKKAVPYANGRWFGFEPEARRATGNAAKPKKPASKPKPAPAEAPVPTSAAEASSLAPHDVDTLAVYADSLAATDAALGEYIQAHIRLHRGEPDDRLAEHARSLFRTHGARWRERWNDPNPLFGERDELFCGLPCSVQLDGFPPALAALDRQLAQLPIQTLSVSGLATRGLAALGGLATLRRITRLLIRGDSKHKLAKPAVAWLAAQALANLRVLGLFSVAVTGVGLREVVDTMPELRELAVSSGQLSAEGLGVLGETGVAPRLEDLNVAYNPLGSAAAAAFAKFPRLRELDLRSTDLGDDLVAVPVPRLPVQKLIVADNIRLGAPGLAWLVQAMPELRELHLPSTLAPEAVASLAPALGRLEAIDASWLNAPAKGRLVDELARSARALRRLYLAGEGAGLARRLVTSLELDTLDLGHVDDDDVAALATASSLSELSIGGGTDASLSELARSPALAKLRTLHVHSRALTEAGIARLLAAPWPLARLELMYARIGDASALPVVRGRPFVLRLFKCDVPRGQLERLRQDWGDRLIA